MDSPIRSKRVALRSGRASCGLYDDYPRLKAVTHNVILGGSQTPDQALQSLQLDGLLPDGYSVSDLWQYIQSASDNAIEQTRQRKDRERKWREAGREIRKQIKSNQPF